MFHIYKNYTKNLFIAKQAFFYLIFDFKTRNHRIFMVCIKIFIFEMIINNYLSKLSHRKIFNSTYFRLLSTMMPHVIKIPKETVLNFQNFHQSWSSTSTCISKLKFVFYQGKSELLYRKTGADLQKKDRRVRTPGTQPAVFF